MIDERRETQATLYALGALPLEEVRDFEMTLRGDLQLQILVTELRTAADWMVASFPRAAPPPALKQRVLTAIDQRLATVSSDSGPAPVESAPLLNWLPWIVAAGFAVLCVILLFVGQSFRRQNGALVEQLSDLREQSAQLQAQRDELQGQLDQVKAGYDALNSDLQKQVAQQTTDLQRQKTDLQKQLDTQSADSQRQITGLKRQLFQSSTEKERLSKELSDAWASINRDLFAQMRMSVLKPVGDAPARALAASIWDIANQKGMLIVEGLPVLPPSLTYQLWLFDGKSPSGPINAGLFKVDEQGAARIQFSRLAVRAEDVSRFAISTERRGGAPAPTKLVLSSN